MHIRHPLRRGFSLMSLYLLGARDAIGGAYWRVDGDYWGGGRA